MERMRKLQYALLTILCTLIAGFAVAQDKGYSDFGATMRSNGRIYVVVAVMLTILAGLILYLVRIEKKLKNLENK
jgi:hypothetical protein